MNHPIYSNILPYLVVSVLEDFSTKYDQFQTYEQALEFVGCDTDPKWVMDPNSTLA